MAGQFVQTVMLSCEANVPGEHCLHEERPTFGPKVPRPHPVHCEAPPVLKKPSGHGTHCSRLPSEAKVPAGQGEHTPLGVRNEPGGQVTLGVTHDVPLLELTVPSGHCVHEAEPMLVVMVLLGQRSQLERPTEDAKVPTGQSRHAVCPSIAENVPKSHCTHSAWPAVAA